MQNSLLSRYSAAVPRYTSYPTAPHFHEGIGQSVYAKWLGTIGGEDRISLYLHIPYCDRLCWFCACHTKHTLKYEPLFNYLESLKKEIRSVGRLVSSDARVTAVHFGGGSPTMVRPADLVSLMQSLRDSFHFAPDAEISVEMDPNDLDAGRYDALAEIGMTRASLGIQDFNPKVQAAINRIQTFEQTKSVVESVRARSVHSVNCDVLYGLPHQTLDTLESTIRDVISLSPDRLALFGYAHVPWMKKHQTMIDEKVLPNVEERFAQMSLAADMLLAAGYEAIGIDHFALPGDRLAIAAREGRLRRNFQGYTDDAAEALIGLGASSIGQLPQGYVQNMPATGEYQRMVDGNELAAVRGIALSSEDRLRRRVIEDLMCRFACSFDQLKAEFGAEVDLVLNEARCFAAGNKDGICEMSGGEFVITPRGRPFARAIAAVFDSYLSSGKGRHSIAV